MEQLKPYNIYSYRELCNSIGEEPVKGGNKRVAQEKRIESHYRLEKVNRKFKIIEIYSEQKEIIDNRKSSLEKCGNLRQTLPLLALGIDDHGNNYKCLMTAKQLLKTTYGSTMELLDYMIKNCYNVFLKEYDYNGLNYAINKFNIILRNFFWNSKLKGGTIDKLERFDFGEVKEYYEIGIKHKINNKNNSDIEEEVEFLEQTEEVHNMIKETTRKCNEQFKKKNIAFYSSKEREKYYKIIANNLGIKDEIFVFSKYDIKINMDRESVLMMKEKEHSQQFLMLKEFYDNYITPEVTGNFDYFLIYSYLFNQLFVGGNKPLKQEFPLNPKEKDLYRTEINRLKTENRELRKENKKLRKANEDMEKRIAELEAKLNAQSENDEEE